MDNYPIGSDNSSAPWNQEDQPEHEIEVTVRITLCKTMKVRVNDYIVWGRDSEGNLDVDYSLCDLKTAVEEQRLLPQEAYTYIKGAKIDTEKAQDFKDWYVEEFEVNQE